MKPFEPEITKIKAIKVLTVTTVGDPNKVAEPFMKALYGTAYGTKMKVFKPKGIKMEIGHLIGRWPDAHFKPKDEWTGIWGLEVPDYVNESDLLQKDPNIPIKLETWDYDEVAQILHLGPYSEEGPAIEKIHKFIEEQGYKIVGLHEEVYLTKPDSKNQKTIIRYPVKGSNYN